MAEFNLGEKIYNLRKAKGLSQKELGALMGVSNKAVSKWETGAAIPKTETLIKLSEVFEIGADELVGGAAAQRNSEQGLPNTIAELSKYTTQFDDNTPRRSVQVWDTIFSVKRAKIYLIGFLAVFVAVILLLISAFDTLSKVFGVLIALLMMTVFSLMACCVYTGIFYLITFINRIPKWVAVFCCLFFFIIIIISFYAGVVMFIPSLIKSISVLIRAKRSN